MLRRAVLLAQLILLAVVIEQTRLVSPAFLRVFQIAGLGVVFYEFTPSRWRPLSFLGLSLVATAAVLRIGPTLFVVAVGLTLIGLCHLPIRLLYRVLLASALGALLVATRAGVSWLPALPIDFLLTLPVLASMFMFRLSIYLYDLENARGRLPFTQTLNYFFMLPNVCFPLFPCVDYTTFTRSYRDSELWEIQQRGVRWILEGIVHLLLVRVVEVYVVRDPNHLVGRLDHVLYVVSAYLMYLRVSGQFHLIVGMLHLFGYDLPRTHNRYFLASSFSDLWRRLNIYWMEYMRKMVYYPVALRLRRLGEPAASIIATVCVFATTIVLHSYQFFWLSGTFSVSTRDLLFWGLLCAFVIFDMQRERRNGARRTVKLGAPERMRWPSIQQIWGVVRTLVLMTILWSLWSSHDTGLRQWWEIVVGVVAP